MGVMGANELPAHRLDRSAAVSAHNTALAGDAAQQLTGRAHASGKAYEDKRAAYAETAAGAVIFGGALPAGATYDDRAADAAFDKRLYKMGRGARGDAEELVSAAGAAGPAAGR